ncbi:CvpA family protein [Marinospirillum sp.]|uniref:CvpA family protein n=1 Tax=Marinospirillum sp. TaxID=2183934 RepID=UPI00287005EC|nr:CvpA family protein [Marinospirillum sp.]MDR9467216.1 CvpA family protein [Marinospirillum sp.]
MMGFNSLDIVFLVILLSSVLLAFWKGFVQQVLSLAGWVAALLAARMLGQQVAPIFASLLADPGLQLAAAYVTITIVVLLASKVICSACGTLIEKIGLGKLDRILGIFFGAVRGVVIIVLGVAVASLTDVRQHSLWQESRLMPYMEEVRDFSASHLDDYISE